MSRTRSRNPTSPTNRWRSITADIDADVFDIALLSCSLC